MQIIVFGLNHKTASLVVREKLAFYKEELPSALGHLAQLPPIEECLILSTCNRVEIYAATPDVGGALNSIREFLLKSKNIDIKTIEKNFYLCTDNDVLTHLFSVASSLDSLVLGEPQILGQLKEAYLMAQKVPTVSGYLNLAIQRSFFVAKKIRSQFSLCKGQVSIGSVAIELIKARLETLDGKKVLVIGSGEICQLILRYLSKEKIQATFIANRTYRKAQELAASFKGTAIVFGQALDYLANVDIVIASTCAPHYILKQDNATDILEKRRKPITILDLAVPRNIDPMLAAIKKVYLYNTDDLKGIANQNLQNRQKEFDLCREIIRSEVQKFALKTLQSNLEPANA
jgi:glutamyl-tRNA reductase